MPLSINIDEKTLQEHGYIKASIHEDTEITITAASSIIGISHTTLKYYVDIGLFPICIDSGKVKLSDVLLADAKDLKRRYIKFRKTQIVER